MFVHYDMKVNFSASKMALLTSTAYTIKIQISCKIRNILTAYAVNAVMK